MHRFGLSIAACLVLGSLGCAREERVGIAGKVELDGQPLASGSITFLPQPGTNSPSAGAEITAGVYRIPFDRGPKPGAFRVQISSSRKTGKRIPVGSPAPVGTTVDEVVEAIPPQYNRESSLAATLTTGDNAFDCHLTTSKASPASNRRN